MTRPFVYVNMAMTADGKITSSRREEPRFTSRRDKTTMDKLRAEADALLVGAGTLRADDPPLHVRDAAMKAHRKELGKPEHLINVLVSASASVDPASKFFSAEHASARIVATVEDAPPEKVAALARVAEVWQAGRGHVDLEQVLERLAARGVERLLVEGGGELNWSFFAKGLVDEIYVTVAPAILGGREAPTLCEGEGFTMEARRKLFLISSEVVDGEIYCRYAVIH